MVEEERVEPAWLADLSELAKWMRANGVKCASVRNMRVEFQGTPNAPIAEVERKPVTEADLKAQAHEKRRAKLKRELGFTPTDEQMERLP